MGLFGSSSNKAKESSSVKPWSKAAPHLEKSFKYGGNLLKGLGPNEAYSGNRVAPLSSQSQAGLTSLFNTAKAPNELQGGASKALSGVMASNGITPEMRSSLGALEATARGDNLARPNPYLMQQIQAAQDSSMNRVKAAASGNGRYGSGAMGKAAGAALGQASIGALSQNFENERTRQLQAAQGALDTYGSGQTRSLQATGLSPTIDNMRYTGAQNMLQAGGVYDQQNQNLLNARMAQFSENQSIPYDRWQQIANTMAGVASPYQTQTSQSPGTSPVLSGMGGAMAGAQLGGMFGPLGMGIGAAGGGLLGLFNS